MMYGSTSRPQLPSRAAGREDGRPFSFRASVLGLTVLTCVVSCQALDEPAPRVEPPTLGESAAISLPSDYFVENLGQLDHAEVRFYHASAGVRVGFAESAIWIVAAESRPMPVDATPAAPEPEPREARGVALRLSFEGANSVVPEGREVQPWLSHYFLGGGERWRQDVRSFGRLAFPDLYDGIDLVYEATGSGPKYHFVVAPGADPTVIRMVWEGAESVWVGEHGELFIDTEVGRLEDAPPVAFDATGETVACPFVVEGDDTVRFACTGWDGLTALTIDPLLASTYLGGGEDEFVRGVDVDANGRTWVAGETSSVDFPTTPGAFAETFQLGAFDAFAACLDPDSATLLSATYLGGGDGDSGFSIALGPEGDIFVTGLTRSPDFPTTQNAWAGAPQDGHEDGFVVRLSPDGDELRYATTLVGATSIGPTRALSIDVDAAGVAYVAGQTQATNFPVTAGAFARRVGNLGVEAFATAVSPNGEALVYSTFLGRGTSSTAWDIAVDASGAYITGTAFRLATSFDAWVVKITTAGDALAWAATIDGLAIDFAVSLALDGRGRVWVGGHTSSVDFPVTPETAYDSSPNGFEDMFLLALDTDGALVYSTLLGGSSRDFGFAVAVDSEGRVTIAGATTSDDFPVTPDAPYMVYQGGRDAIIARLSADGSVLEASSYLGGPSAETPMGAAISPRGVVIAGNTTSISFPVTTDAFQVEPGGGSDAFVATLAGPGGNPPAPLTLIVPADLTLECDVDPDPAITGVAVAQGTCGGGAVTFIDQVLTGSCAGESVIQRLWSASDDCGTTASGLQVITLADRIGPLLTVPGGANLSCRDSTDVEETGIAVASDACGPVASVTFGDVVTAPGCALELLTSRTWTAVDGCGNASAGVQLLQRVDVLAPTITCPAPFSVDAQSAGGAVVPVAPDGLSDDCDAAPSVTSNAPAVFPIGTTQVTLTATDACGAAASCSTEVTVRCHRDDDDDDEDDHGHRDDDDDDADDDDDPCHRDDDDDDDDDLGQSLTLLDFEGLPAGTIVTDQFSGLAVSADNATRNHPDLAIIFDSAAPTGDDGDLATPGSGAGNDEALGHLLIIAERVVDANADGLVDEPDDEAYGGVLIIAFDEPVALARMTVIDIEELGGTIELFAGNEHVFSGEIPQSTDNSVQHLSLAQVTGRIDRIEVHLAGSGALDNVAYCAAEECLADDGAPADLVVVAPVEP